MCVHNKKCIVPIKWTNEESADSLENGHREHGLNPKK